MGFFAADFLTAFFLVGFLLADFRDGLPFAAARLLDGAGFFFLTVFRADDFLAGFRLTGDFLDPLVDCVARFVRRLALFDAAPAFGLRRPRVFKAPFLTFLTFLVIDIAEPPRRTR